MRNCLIIAAAPELEIEYIKAVYSEIQPEMVICADGGINKAKALSINCDILMGDMDSGGTSGAKETVTFPAEKNYTDTQTCIEEAIRRNFDAITVVGGCGGRIDHLLCNIHLLEAAQKKGVNCVLRDKDNIISVFKNGKFDMPKDFKYFSIIPLDEVLEGVTLKNCKYPLENHKVYRADSLTVSNEPKDGKVFAEIKKGSAILIFSR